MFFFFQAEDGIRDLVRSRGLGDVYKRQEVNDAGTAGPAHLRGRVVLAARELVDIGRQTDQSLSLIHI